MTENKSAMDRLREILDKWMEEPMIEDSCERQLEFAIRTVLAAHDAAQSVPPSESAKAWRHRMVGAIGMWGELPPGDDKYEAYHSKVCPALDEAVRNWSQQPAPKVEPSEAAKAWAGRMSDAVVLFERQVSAEARSLYWKQTIVPLLDEAVRRMSRAEPVAVRIDDCWLNRICGLLGQWRDLHIAKDRDAANAMWESKVFQELQRARDLLLTIPAEPVAEAPKRLRPGWREAMTDAAVTYACTMPNAARSRFWDATIAPLLDEAEASAAPAPQPQQAQTDYAALYMQKMNRDLKRANAIIDALLAAQGRQP